MTHSTISLGVGLGGGKASTSSGRPSGGGWVNEYSLSMDGTDDLLALPNLSYLSGASAFSLSIWFKTSATSKYLYSSAASGLNDSIQMYWNGSELRWILGTGSNFAQKGVTSGTFNDGNWHHAVFRFDGSSNSMKIYVDASEQTTTNRYGTTVPSASATNAGNTPRIGADTSGGSNIAAIIDEMAFFDSALSASDITSIYNSGVPTDITLLGPVGWWRMGDGGTWDGTDWTIPDASTNSNAGTTANMAEGSRVTDIPS